MRRLDGLDSLPHDLPWPVVTVGTFDGVHVGHQRVLSEVVSWARRHDGTAVTVTFAQPPRLLLTGDDPPLLTSLPHRLRLLAHAGIDLCVVLTFTREVARMSASTFVRDVIAGGLSARGVVMGPGSVFGRDREGTEAFVRAQASSFGFEVRSVDAVRVGGGVVSSTRIRDAVGTGDFEVAARLLGRAFSVFGTVVRGAGRGRELGFPTANLDLHHEITPPEGVYVAQAVLDDREVPALVSVGSRPTFSHADGDRSTASVVEIYLIDFEGQLYGHDVEARFLKRLRGQMRFDGVSALVARMEGDLHEARAFFAAGGA